AVAASVGVASLALAGDIAWQETARNWGTWWLGDVAGQMIVVPFVLAIAGKHWTAVSRLSLAELVLLLALMVLVGHAAFAGWFSERIAHDCRCLPAILLIWLGLRFSLLEVSGGMVLFAAAAFGGALQGAQAGDLGDVHYALFDLQVLVNVYALTGLALVGIVAARRRAEGALTDSLQNLERLVSDRTRQLVVANEALQRKVAEQKKAAGTVRESERRFRTLFEQAGDALFVVSMDGKLVDFNRRAAEALGYPRDELLRLRVPDIDVEHDSARFRQLASDVDPESVTIVRSICRRKDGTTSPIEIRACAIELDGERHMLALVYEITSRKRMEEFERLQLDYVFDSIGDGVLVTNRDGTIQLVNPSFERITGYSRDELIGQNPRILQGGSHDRKFYEDMWKTLTDGHVWRGSFVDKRKDGLLYDAEVSIAPVRAASGEIGGYIAVTRDVSERNRMAQALRESEARMRAVVENATDGIITFNEQGQIESCNPAAAQVFAYSADEMLDRNITLLLPGPWHAACGTSLEQFLHTGRCTTLDENRELLGKRKDGSQFPMELGVSKIQLGNRRLFTGIVRDTTERHARQKAERALLVNEASLRIARSIQQGFFP
ncbi:MAG: PAS domain S-box protein, partial [Planctomycetes bacterium]|nr:PAS domain S-box protein [Planctomycetota bacterium]